MINDELKEYIKREIASVTHIPIGAIFAFPSEKIPEGFLPCEGQELSRIQYPELFTLIGTAFGGTAKTFCLPDLQGQFIRGLDRAGNTDIKEDGKTRQIGEYQDDAIQGHKHVSGETNKGGSHKHNICFMDNPLYYGTNTFSNNEEVRIYEPWDYSDYDEDDDEDDYNSSLIETDEVKGHTHKFSVGGVSNDSYGKIRVASETRPKNISLIYCIKVK